LRVQVTAGAYVLLDQLLPHADSLKIHPKYGGHRRGGGAQVRFPGDLVQNGVHLECVVTLNVLETVGPRSSLRRIRNGRTRHFQRCRDSGQLHHRRVDLRRVIVIHVRAVARATHRRVRGMLVGPGSVAARLVDHAEDRIGAYEIPRINRVAGAIAYQARRIDRFDTPIRKAGAGRPAV
jgi:hypothetical protein